MDTRRKNSEEINKHLFRLGALDDYKVASDNPDVRQWAVIDKNGHQLGTVFDLIVDVNEDRVRYLDVLPNEDIFNKLKGYILIPIGAARIDEKESKVVVDRLDKEIVRDYPVYQGDILKREYEVDVLNRFNNSKIGDSNRDMADFYGDQLFDQDRFYSDRNRSL